MLQRMEIAMRLAIGGEHLVQPFAFIVQTIVIAFRKQLANPLFRLFHIHGRIPFLGIMPISQTKTAARRFHTAER